MNKQEDLYQLVGEFLLIVWDDYIYKLIILKFIRLLTNEYFNDFPDNTNADLLELLSIPIQDVAESSISFDSKINNVIANVSKRYENYNLGLSDKDFKYIFTKLIKGRKKDGKEVLMLKEDANKVLHETLDSKFLIMVFSYLDSFLDDCLLYVSLFKDNEWMEKKVKLSFNDLKNSDTDFVFIRNYIEQHYTMGLTIDKRISKLVKKIEKGKKRSSHTYQTEIYKSGDIPADVLALLKEGEQVRHILVHNFGNIDKRFIKNTGLTIYSENQKYPLTHEFVNKLIVEISNVIDIIGVKMCEFIFMEYDEIGVEMYLENRY